jgi:hypothetical protein
MSQFGMSQFGMCQNHTSQLAFHDVIGQSFNFISLKCFFKCKLCKDVEKREVVQLKKISLLNVQVDYVIRRFGISYFQFIIWRFGI